MAGVTEAVVAHKAELDQAEASECYGSKVHSTRQRSLPPRIKTQCINPMHNIKSIRHNPKLHDPYPIGSDILNSRERKQMLLLSIILENEGMVLEVVGNADNILFILQARVVLKAHSD